MVSLARASLSRLASSSPSSCSRSAAFPTTSSRLARSYATISSSKPHHKVVIVGGGSAGVTVAAQLKRSQAASEHLGKDGDIAILDPAERHHYQPGWTLAGTGLARLSDMSRPMSSIIPSGVQHYPLKVSTFDPSNNSLTTAEGIIVSYDYLIVAPGLKTDISSISGLESALADPDSSVSSIYNEPTVEKLWRDIKNFKGGNAIFTQPAGVIKCAGAPQKALWVALSEWKNEGIRDSVKATFATGMEAMFAVPKYAKALEQLRKERDVEGLFQHNLVKVDAKNRIATFKQLAEGEDGKTIERPFDLLHVVPRQKPWDFVAKSPLADPATGWVSVNQSSTQHTKFKNVFSIGDASSLPNSKTAAAITSQVPVLVDNLLATIRGENLQAKYSGYASCPLLTGHNELMLCEFKYGGVPAETFSGVFGSQDIPRRAFYHLKKDVFPLVYWNSFVKGTWYGPSGFTRPDTTLGA